LRYLDSLLGGTLQEIPQVYRDRSPLYHAHLIESPLLVLQGSEDKVVPPSQAEAIVEAIQKRGGIVKYVVLEGEGHGFRGADAIRKALENEEEFYAKQFGF